MWTEYDLSGQNGPNRTKVKQTEPYGPNKTEQNLSGKIGPKGPNKSKVDRMDQIGPN